jgi:hypothetical protein
LVAARAGLVLGAALVALLLGEGALRVVARVQGVDFTLYMRELTNSDRLPKGLQNDHPTLLWCLNPRAQVLATTSDFSVRYQVNSKGLRDTEYSYKKPPGTIRAVVLGDSLTFGEGIPYGERYSDIPEREYENLEMLNMAVPGYGLDQMLLFFAEEGVKYKPDVVVVVVAATVLYRHNLGDKWLDADPIEKLALDAAADAGPSATIYRQAHDRVLSEDRSVLLRSSYLFSYADYLLTLRKLAGHLAKKDEATWAHIKANDTVPLPESPTTRAYDAYLGLALRRLAALAAKLEFQIVVANVDPTYTPRVSLTELPPSARVLDFGPALREAAKQGRLRFRYDPHFNPATHRLIGKLLSEGLKSHVPRLQPR